LTATLADVRQMQESGQAQGLQFATPYIMHVAIMAHKNESNERCFKKFKEMNGGQ
jgi:hypothetical protein